MGFILVGQDIDNKIRVYFKPDLILLLSSVLNLSSIDTET